MKWSAPLVVGSIGIRIGDVHVNGSVAVLMTMSFELQPERKRQSCQTTYTRPSASTSAEGSAEVRRFPATVWSVTRLIETGLVQLAPPSVE